MHTMLAPGNYIKEIENFIGLSIDEVNVFLEPRLFVGGFSLVNIIDSKRKIGRILEISGKIHYQKCDLNLEVNTHFDKNIESRSFFESEANKIRDNIMADPRKIINIDFENNCMRALINFDDKSEMRITANNANHRPLIFEDHAKKYSVFYGETSNGRNNFDYYKFLFS